MYLNKNEVQAIIAEQRTNHAEVSYVDLDFVAKIVEKFENPKLLDENNVEKSTILVKNCVSLHPKTVRTKSVWIS